MKKKGNQKKPKLKPAIFLPSEKETKERKRRAKGEVAKNYGKKERKQGNVYLLQEILSSMKND